MQKQPVEAPPTPTRQIYAHSMVDQRQAIENAVKLGGLIRIHTHRFDSSVECGTDCFDLDTTKQKLCTDELHLGEFFSPFRCTKNEHGSTGHVAVGSYKGRSYRVSW